MNHNTKKIKIILVLIIVLACIGAALFIIRANQSELVQAKLNQLTQHPNIPGAVISMRQPNGTTKTFTAGVSDITTGQKMVGAEGRYRVGSLTKSIIAATLVQLAYEQKVNLDSPIEHYLPGLVRGTGEGSAISGNNISVRQLLQHTSGLPDFLADVDLKKESTLTPTDFVRIALAKKPEAQPGELSYSNTNYVLAALLIEKLTGQTYQVATQARIFEPLGMKDTYWPIKGDLGIQGAHAHNYVLGDNNQLTDLTQLSGYDAGASGGLISTPADMNSFWHGLYANQLFPKSFVDAMTDKAMALPDTPGQPAHSHYGLGIVKAELSCGQPVWLHGGDLEAVTTISGRNAAGRVATVYVTTLLQDAKQGQQLLDVFDTALCAK